MRSTVPRPQGRHATRRISGHAQQDHLLDPYQSEQKLLDGSVCPTCGALYRDGRWQWTTSAAPAQKRQCPACRRIAERFPAGIVTLRGPFAPAEREHLVSLARHEEAAEKREHPLNRIIDVEDGADAIVINTTDIHLPRRIGQAVKRAFHGDLTAHFEKDGYFVRVDWSPPQTSTGRPQ
jgi:NMD protein affecting ribosome stability and mRNA decay